MKIFKLKDFTRGWIIGDFEPSIIKTKEFEVRVDTYPKGFVDKKHVHKVADEITVIVNGSGRADGNVYRKGDILWIKPGEWIQFEAIEDCTIAVVKIPSLKGDKYYQ